MKPYVAVCSVSMLMKRLYMFIVHLQIVSRILRKKTCFVITIIRRVGFYLTDCDQTLGYTRLNSQFSSFFKTYFRDSRSNSELVFALFLPMVHSVTKTRRLLPFNCFLLRIKAGFHMITTIATVVTKKS